MPAHSPASLTTTPTPLPPAVFPAAVDQKGGNMARRRIRALAQVVQVALVVLCVTSGMWAAEETKGTPLESFKPDKYGFISHWLGLDESFALPELGEQKFRDSSADKEFFPGMHTNTPKEGDQVKPDDKDLEDFWKTKPSDNKFRPGVMRTWQAMHSDSYRNSFVPRHNALYLAVTYITCEKDFTEVRLKAGAGDFGVCLLNGKEIIRAVKGAKAITIDAETSETVTLKQGVNVLMVKVLNGYGGETSFCARFVDKTDKAVTAVTISLTPPPSAK